jgi:erythromycin esterase-like protein
MRCTTDREWAPDESGREDQWSGAVEEMRGLARPLVDEADLDELAASLSASRFVCLGEASHGTAEYYRWRAALSKQLIQAHGFTWIGVEGDWPDCWRINRWVRGRSDQVLDAVHLLGRFERWPTWMWANREVAEFLDWLHGWNMARPEPERVGFYGLDVYSLWDSLLTVIAWLERNAGGPARRGGGLAVLPTVR